LIALDCALFINIDQDWKWEKNSASMLPGPFSSLLFHLLFLPFSFLPFFHPFFHYSCVFFFVQGSSLPNAAMVPGERCELSSFNGFRQSPVDKRLLLNSKMKIMLPVIALLQKFR